MSQEEAVCNLYEWVLPLRPFPSYRFLPFSSCLPSFLFLSSSFACRLRKQKR